MAKLGDDCDAMVLGFSAPMVSHTQHLDLTSLSMNTDVSTFLSHYSGNGTPSAIRVLRPRSRKRKISISSGVVTLRNWTISPACDENGIIVKGYHETNGKEKKSGRITNRIDSHRVMSSSGITYDLIGEMHKSQSSDSLVAYKYFSNGFTEDWKEMEKKYLEWFKQGTDQCKPEVKRLKKFAALNRQPYDSSSDVESEDKENSLTSDCDTSYCAKNEPFSFDRQHWSTELKVSPFTVDLTSKTSKQTQGIYSPQGHESPATEKVVEPTFATISQQYKPALRSHTASADFPETTLSNARNLKNNNGNEEITKTVESSNTNGTLQLTPHTPITFSRRDVERVANLNDAPDDEIPLLDEITMLQTPLQKRRKTEKPKVLEEKKMTDLDTYMTDELEMFPSYFHLPCALTKTDAVNKNHGRLQQAANSNNKRKPATRNESISEPSEEKQTHPEQSSTIRKISEWAIVFKQGQLQVEGLVLQASDRAVLCRTGSVLEVAERGRHIMTSGGSCYRLVGDMSQHHAIGAGVPANVAKKFRKGFPRDWRSCLRSLADLDRKGCDIHQIENSTTRVESQPERSDTVDHTHEDPQLVVESPQKKFGDEKDKTPTITVVLENTLSLEKDIIADGNSVLLSGQFGQTDPALSDATAIHIPPQPPVMRNSQTPKNKRRKQKRSKSPIIKPKSGKEFKPTEKRRRNENSPERVTRRGTRKTRRKNHAILTIIDRTLVPTPVIMSRKYEVRISVIDDPEMRLRNKCNKMGREPDGDHVVPTSPLRKKSCSVETGHQGVLVGGRILRKRRGKVETDTKTNNGGKQKRSREGGNVAKSRKRKKVDEKAKQAQNQANKSEKVRNNRKINPETKPFRKREKVLPNKLEPTAGLQKNQQRVARSNEKSNTRKRDGASKVSVSETLKESEIHRLETLTEELSERLEGAKVAAVKKQKKSDQARLEKKPKWTNDKKTKLSRLVDGRVGWDEIAEVMGFSAEECEDAYENLFRAKKKRATKKKEPVGTTVEVTARRGTLKHRKQVQRKLEVLKNPKPDFQDLFSSTDCTAAETSNVFSADLFKAMDFAGHMVPVTPNAKPPVELGEMVATPAWFKTPSASAVTSGASFTQTKTPAGIKDIFSPKFFTHDGDAETKRREADRVIVQMQKRMLKGTLREVKKPQGIPGKRSHESANKKRRQCLDMDYVIFRDRKTDFDSEEASDEEDEYFDLSE